MISLSSVMDRLTGKKSGPRPVIAFSQTIQTDPIENPPPPFLVEKAFSDRTVTAGVASFPARISNLKYCVDSLYDQCDYICVYLNGYEEVPDFLRRPKILPFLSRDYIDLNATGKVFFIDWAKDGYYFTIDDDFLYPSDYVAKMTSKIDLYGRRCAVTVHGSIFPEQFTWYYERTAMYQYQAPIATDRFVHLPGSGSFAFHKSTVKMNVENFLPKVMVDLSLAILCKRQRVPIVSVARPSMWMMNTERSGLFQQFSKTITHHTTYAVVEAPWSFGEYASYVNEIVLDVFGRSKIKRLHEFGLDSDFIDAAQKGKAPSSWQDTMTNVRRRMDAMKMGFA